MINSKNQTKYVSSSVWEFSDVLLELIWKEITDQLFRFIDSKLFLDLNLKNNSLKNFLRRKLTDEIIRTH